LTFMVLLGGGLVLLVGWLAVRWGWLFLIPDRESGPVRAAWQWVERFGWTLGILGVVAALFSRSAVYPASGPSFHRDATEGVASIAAPVVDDRVRGRGELVDQLRALFAWRGRRAPRVWVLYGLGGSGKTTVAASAASRVQADGVTVW